MNFTISKNKELDYEMIGLFLEGGSPLIQSCWPGLNTVEDIPKFVDAEYGPKMESRIQELKTDVPKLERIAEAISVVMDEKWSPIDEISIYVGACPIAPRFLDVHAFLMPYYHDLSYAINTSAHEMIHFLYFKKWASLFPESKPENFESPDPVWVLSEILVAVIGNDSRIKDLVGNAFEVYPNWKDIKIDRESLTAPFEKIYKNSTSFDAFLKDSWSKYQELDKKFKITDILTHNMF